MLSKQRKKTLQTIIFSSMWVCILYKIYSKITCGHFTFNIIELIFTPVLLFRVGEMLIALSVFL